MKKISEIEFDKKYKLVINHFERAKHPDSISDEDVCSFNGTMFETFGEHLEFVKEMAKENRVITILEGDDESCFGECEACECGSSIYYVSGLRFVNRIGYLVTEEPFTEEFECKIDDVW